jgi:hypothetical protein
METTTQIPQATLAALAAPVPHLDGTRAVFDPAVWIRVCRPGERCKYSGLSRSTIRELTVPGPRNDFSPPVESRLLKRKGAARGILLVNKLSLLAWISGQPAPTRADVVEDDAQADARAELAASAARVAAITGGVV